MDDDRDGSESWNKEQNDLFSYEFQVGNWDVLELDDSVVILVVNGDATESFSQSVVLN
jgi:hypothetical protein